MQSYLNELNPAQKEAVVNFDGPSLVIAGAGSGKTRVLTYRIAYLLSQGVSPYRILALTFTNKAAREMKQRIGAIIGDQFARQLWMGTFHSVFGRILRMEAEKLNFKSSFTIYDNADSKSLVKSILKEMRIKDKNYKPGLILSRISSAKNDLILPKAYSQDQNRMVADKASGIPLTYEIYARYVKHCTKSGAMDFDDLLLNTNILFRDFPESLARYQDQFLYVLVDEYQDTNISQYLIVRKLAEKHKNICVVGDDAQSIYSFRGARIQNILNFRNDYPGYQLYKLEQNYRSTQNIVNVANSIISKNSGQIEKVVYSKNDEGDKVKFLSAYSDIEEGFLVVKDLVRRQSETGCSFADFAILYRTNAQSRIFEEAFRKASLPYKIYGGLSFYQRKEIKDLLAYLRVVVNPSDQEALKRIINYPARGIGKTTTDKLEAAAIANDISIWEVLTHPSLASVGFNAGTLKKLGNFSSMIKNMGSQILQSDAYEITKEIAIQSGLIKELQQDKSIEGQTRVENIDELLNGVRDFVDEKIQSGQSASLIEFLEEVSLLTDQDNEGEEGVDKITMMTIHSAKGLEFENVYITGVEEGLFPSPMSIDSREALEEERRLFYVAVTRAQKAVTLSFAKSRFKYGEHNFVTPSRFIRDLDVSCIDEESLSFIMANKQPSFKERQKKVFNPFNSSSSSSQLKRSSRLNKRGFEDKDQQDASQLIKAYNRDVNIGNRVEHDRFGHGKVIDLEGVPPNVKAVVEFDNAGVKQLLLKFARLKILS
ncbi:3'-5' exonuclease [Marinilabiliaceae bacterium ANBcel2]|nr:3'-5' exonuclease [Marinilabiliaceae bacterium ANBcel2]